MFLCKPKGNAKLPLWGGFWSAGPDDWIREMPVAQCLLYVFPWSNFRSEFYSSWLSDPLEKYDRRGLSSPSHICWPGCHACREPCPMISILDTPKWSKMWAWMWGKVANPIFRQKIATVCLLQCWATSYARACLRSGVKSRRLQETCEIIEIMVKRGIIAWAQTCAVRQEKPTRSGARSQVASTRACAKGAIIADLWVFRLC